MSLFTAIIEHTKCDRCGGIGSVSEFVDCECFDGCEKCFCGKVEVSCSPCVFCAGSTYSFAFQFECYDEDTCVALIKGKLTREKGFVDNDEYCAILECPVPLECGSNVWGIDLADGNQWFNIHIVKTEKPSVV